MPKIFPVTVKKVRKVVQQIGGVLNFPLPVDLGVQVRTSAKLIAAKVASAFSVTRISASLNTNVKPAVNVLKAFFTGDSKQFVDTGFDVRNSTQGFPVKQDARPAGKLIRLQYDLTRLNGADTVNQTAVGGRSDWTNPNNTLGTANGTTATIAGNALAARGGRLNWTYPTPVNKDALVIQSVRLRFYASQAGTVLNNGSLTFGYKLNGGADVQLQAFPANFDNIATPIDYDLTGVVGGSWGNVGGITTYSTFQTAALNTSSAAIDAVELEVVASLTENL